MPEQQCGQAHASHQWGHHCPVGWSARKDAFSGTAGGTADGQVEPGQKGTQTYTFYAPEGEARFGLQPDPQRWNEPFLKAPPL